MTDMCVVYHAIQANFTIFSLVTGQTSIFHGKNHIINNMSVTIRYRRDSKAANTARII